MNRCRKSLIRIARSSTRQRRQPWQPSDVGGGLSERPWIAAVALCSLAKTSLVGFIRVHFWAEKGRSQ